MHMRLSQFFRGIVAVVGFGTLTAVAAAPFRPNDDAQVLERLPSRSTPQFRDLKALQSAAASAPGDLTRALPLATAYIRASRVDDAGRLWAETLLGEIAHRRRDHTAAARHFRAALGAGDKDAYLLAAYADWLLDQGRPAEVIALLQGESRNDTLLLRLALAQHALARPEAVGSIETLHARFDASHARGDTVHARENARFELLLNNNAGNALPYALESWRVQREPADLRILAETAVAANDVAALEAVRRWLAETGIEYLAVAALASGKAAPQ